MPSNPGDYDAVRQDVKKLLKQPEYDDGSAGPVLVRLAWYVSARQPCGSRFPVAVPVLDPAVFSARVQGQQVSRAFHVFRARCAGPGR